jgi:hypothetical protein
MSYLHDARIYTFNWLTVHPCYVTVTCVCTLREGLIPGSSTAPTLSHVPTLSGESSGHFPITVSVSTLERTLYACIPLVTESRYPSIQ